VVGTFCLNQVKTKQAPKATQGKKTARKGTKETPSCDADTVAVQLPKPLMDALDAIMAITGEQVSGAEWIYNYLHGAVSDEPASGFFASFLEGAERRKAMKAIRPIVDAYGATCETIDMSFLEPRLRAKFFTEAERKGITPRALLAQLLAKAFAAKREAIMSQMLNQKKGEQAK
jgi:hypothetical protein